MRKKFNSYAVEFQNMGECAGGAFRLVIRLQLLLCGFSSSAQETAQQFNLSNPPTSPSSDTRWPHGFPSRNQLGRSDCWYRSSGVSLGIVSADMSTQPSSTV